MNKYVFSCVCYWITAILACICAVLQFAADNPFIGTVWIVVGVLDLWLAIFWTVKLVKERRNKQ